jgi:hypothetical protein
MKPPLLVKRILTACFARITEKVRELITNSPWKRLFKRLKVKLSDGRLCQNFRSCSALFWDVPNESGAGQDVTLFVRRAGPADFHFVK